MNVWYAKSVLVLGTVAMVAIRAPHGQRSRSVPIARNRRGPLENVLLAIAMLSFFVPLLWIGRPVFAFAEYEPHVEPIVTGAIVMALALVLFHRSHADLGTNWSVTLQVRERHTLVTNGVYRSIRHPMYAALLLYSVGQALVVPNWIAGPSYLVAMALLFALRVVPEERMMREQFGSAYDDYCARTKRLVPGVW